MSVYSYQAVAALALSVGLRGENAAIAVAIAAAESGLRDDATGYNGPTGGCPYGSKDRGLWQINNCYHPDISDACAYDANCNARAMIRISSNGTNWHPWSTYNSGAYLRYISAARVAVGVTAGGGTSDSRPPSYFDPVGYGIWRINNGANPFDALGDTFRRFFQNVRNLI